MQLSDAEWIVMSHLWDAQRAEAGDVIAVLAGPHGWSDATVKTMLHRLVKKGALATEKTGKKYRYTTVVKRSDCVRRASRSFIERVFGGAAAPALLHLVRTSKLTAEEVAELRDLLDSKHHKKGSKE